MIRILRALNLLEPGKNIVSITKTAMWVCVVGLAMSLFTSRPIDLPTLLAFFSTSALYAWRRYVQWKTGVILPENPADPQSAPPAG